MAVSTLVKASITGSQGGSSNLQRFKAHHLPTFRGGGDPTVADHWFRQVGKDIRGYGDHLRCHPNKTSNILARG